MSLNQARMRLSERRARNGQGRRRESPVMGVQRKRQLVGGRNGAINCGGAARTLRAQMQLIQPAASANKANVKCSHHRSNDVRNAILKAKKGRYTLFNRIRWKPMKVEGTLYV